MREQFYPFTIGALIAMLCAVLISLSMMYLPGDLAASGSQWCPEGMELDPSGYGCNSVRQADNPPVTAPTKPDPITVPDTVPMPPLAVDPMPEPMPDLQPAMPKSKPLPIGDNRLSDNWAAMLIAQQHAIPLGSGHSLGFGLAKVGSAEAIGLGYALRYQKTAYTAGVMKSGHDEGVGAGVEFKICC